MRKEGVPTEIRINVYENSKRAKINCSHQIKIPVYNMSKEDCLRFRDYCNLNPYFGTVHILLDNGNHI